MIEVKYTIGGQVVSPRDGNDVKITMDWLNRKQEPSINIENLTIVGKEGTLLKERILNGLVGGLGVFQGEKASVSISDNGGMEQFDGYLDFTNDLLFTGNCEVTANFKKEQGTDWLNEVADGFSYRYLYDIGVVDNNDFVDVPYVINYVPDGTELMLLSLSLFTLTKELLEQSKALATRIADLTAALTPILGVSAVGPTVSYNVGAIIAEGIKLLVQIAYTVAIIIALVKLFEQLIEQLMPPIRYLKGIPVRLLFQRACDYLGLTLQSSLLDSIDQSNAKWCFLSQQSGTTKGDGLPTQGSIQDTFAGVITTYKNLFNADFRISNGVFQFERKDSFETLTPYTIPNTFTDQDKLQDLVGLNTGEILANYNINWSVDVQDQNTLDNQTGRLFQAQTVPKRLGDPKLLNIKGLKEVAIPMALATRKDNLTTIEQVLKGIVTVLDALTGQLGNGNSLSGKIKNRVGAMNLSSKLINTDKVVVMAGTRLTKEQHEYTGAAILWEKYHSIESFVPINGVHNQYYLYKEQPIKFCFKDFVSLANGNNVQTQTGERAEIETLEWDVLANKATITYRVNRLYDLNLTLKEL